MYNKSMEEKRKNPEAIKLENTIFLIVITCIVIFGIYVSKLSHDRIDEVRNKTSKSESESYNNYNYSYKTKSYNTKTPKKQRKYRY